MFKITTILVRRKEIALLVFSVDMCVGKNQMCYGAVGFIFVLFSSIVIFLSLLPTALLCAVAVVLYYF